MGDLEGDVAERGHVDRLRFVEARRVRSDEDANVLQARVAARPDRLDPPLDECGLAGGSAKQRGTQVDDKPPIRAEADPPAETVATPPPTAPQPLIVRM